MKDLTELQSMQKFASQVLEIPLTPISPKRIPILPTITSKHILSPSSPASTPTQVRFTKFASPKPPQSFKRNPSKLQSVPILKDLRTKVIENLEDVHYHRKPSKQTSSASQTRPNTRRSGQSKILSKDTPELDEELCSLPHNLHKFVERLIQENDKSPQKASHQDKKFSRHSKPARENSSKFQPIKQQISPKNKPSLFNTLKIKTSRSPIPSYNIKRLNSGILLTASNSPRSTIKIPSGCNSPSELSNLDHGDRYLYTKELALSSLYDQSKKIQKILHFCSHEKIDRLFNKISHKISLETERFLSS